MTPRTKKYWRARVDGGENGRMNWSDRFSQRSRLMRRTAVRELLKLTARPGVISFAGGLPAPELFPVEETKAALDRVLSRRAGPCLQYGETEGVAELREWVARRYSRPDCRVERRNVVITSGSQQGLDLLGRILLDKGDRVLVENPTYLALLSAWRPLAVEFLPVPMDEEGACAEVPEFAANAKLFYTLPTFQNPSGRSMSAARRRRVLDRCREADLVLVEDDPYGELRYDGDGERTLLELDAADAGGGLDQGSVAHVGTFSKVLGPGFRIGWVIAPEEVVERLVRAKQSADLHTSTLMQWGVLELVEMGVLDAQLPRLRAVYRERRDAMLGALGKWFPPGATWTEPGGGMFLMVRVPGIDGDELLASALERNVAFVPGEEFHVDGTGKDTLRLNFSNATPERIEAGVRRLAQTIRQGS